MEQASGARMNTRRMSGRAPKFASLAGADAPATRQFLRERKAAVAV